MSECADYLFELGCEELPAAALAHINRVLPERAEQALAQHELNHKAIRGFATPRRIALLVSALDRQQPDTVVERRGPSLEQAYDADGNPSPALTGFARSVGVEQLDALERRETPKGVWLYARIDKPGRSAEAILPEVINDVLQGLPTGRTMRWGGREDSFLRPVRWVVSVHGEQIVPLMLFGVDAGCTSLGHRVHCPKPLPVNPGNYEKILLEQGFVLADFAQRRERIVEQVQQLADQLGYAAHYSDELLDEITALCEWPIAVHGSFPEEYLEVPQQALIASMQSHQKYIALLQDDGTLANRFITIANLRSDEPEQVVTGNERVLRPRLADARFFYRNDLQQPLEQSVPQLDKVRYHRKLGSLGDKTARLVHLVGSLGRAAGVDKSVLHGAERASLLAKVDLMSSLVGEFPDLQGDAGGIYARAQGEDDAVAEAIAHHYRPQYLTDDLPNTDNSAALLLALADKLDSLTGLLAAGETPKADRDPFGLRRAALGMWRLCLHIEVDDAALMQAAQEAYKQQGIEIDDDVCQNTLQFIHERLPTWYERQGISPSLLKAVLAIRPASARQLDSRVRALHSQMGGEVLAVWVQINKRIANILPADAPSAEVRQEHLQEQAERDLFALLQQQLPSIEQHTELQNWDGLFESYAQISPAVEKFFEDVMVMAQDTALRDNRLALLVQLRQIFLRVGDLALVAISE